MWSSNKTLLKWAVRKKKSKREREREKKNDQVIHSFDIGFNAQTLFIFQELFEMRTRLFRIDTKNKRNEAIASARRWLPAALNLVRHFFSMLILFGCCCSLHIFTVRILDFLF